MNPPQTVVRKLMRGWAHETDALHAERIERAEVAANGGVRANRIHRPQDDEQRQLSLRTKAVPQAVDTAISRSVGAAAYPSLSKPVFCRGSIFARPTSFLPSKPSIRVSFLEVFIAVCL